MTDTIYPYNNQEYHTDQYKEEIDKGKRMSSGARKLKRLNKKHMEIIRLHVMGYKGGDIAQAMETSDAFVSTLLRDPLAQDVIKKAHEQVEDEFNALYGQVVDTIRDALQKEVGLNTRLRGVDRYAKMKQVNGDQRQGQETAEDVVNRILQLNIQVNTGKDGG